MSRRGGGPFLCNRMTAPPQVARLASVLHSKKQSGSQKQLKRNSNLYLNLSKHCKGIQFKPADSYKRLSSFLFLSPEPGILPTFAFFPSHSQLSQLPGLFPSRLFLSNSLHKCLRLRACLFSPFSLTSPPPPFSTTKKNTGSDPAARALALLPPLRPIPAWFNPDSQNLGSRLHTPERAVERAVEREDGGRREQAGRGHPKSSTSSVPSGTHSAFLQVPLILSLPR